MSLEVLLSLASGIASDALTGAINNVAGSRREYRKLKKSVKVRTGIKPRGTLKRWLQTDATWNQLTISPAEAQEKLIILMDEELRTQFTLFPKNRTPAERRRQAEDIVQAAIDLIVEVLDPSRAISVVDRRVRHEIASVKKILEDRPNFEDLLTRVPPNAHEALRRLAANNIEVAWTIVNLAIGKDQPGTAISATLSIPPTWLTAAPREAQLSLAEMAHSYGLPKEASTLFELASETGIERARLLARAALSAAGAGDEERSARLLDKARLVGGHTEFVEIISAAIANEAARIVTLGAERMGDYGEVAAIIAQAVAQENGLERGCEALRHATEVLPQYPGLKIQLALLIIERSGGLALGLTEGEAKKVFHLLITARDDRRLWRGDSVRPTIHACEIALARGNYAEALAWSLDEIEQSSSTVDTTIYRLAADAALASMRFELVEDLVSRVEQDSDRQRLEADYLVATGGDKAAAARKYKSAFALAANEHEKLSCWFGLATLGEDLPGIDELVARNDISSTVILARRDEASGMTDNAIARLRLWRNRSAHAAEELVRIHLQAGQIDDAVSVLLNAADHFNIPGYKGRAALILASRNIFDAEQIASDALSLITSDIETRGKLHEILIACSEKRQAWREMESRLHRMISDTGSSSEVRWLLTGAIYNQRKLDDAWRELQSEPALRPQDVPQARVWIDLHTRFRSDDGLVGEALEIAIAFPQSSELAAATIGSILTSPSRIQIPETLRPQWDQFVAEFLDRNPDHPLFRTLQIPEDATAEEITEILRPLLEPGTRQFTEIAHRVQRAEAPYGVIAVAAGKPYTVALIYRAAGCLPIASVDPETLSADVSDANSSIESIVYIDVSAIAVLSYIPWMWPRVLQSFRHVVATVAARADVARSVDQLAAPSDGHLGWDVNLGRPSISENDPEAKVALTERAKWINDHISELDVVDHPTLIKLPKPPGERPEDPFLSWLTPLDAAIKNNQPLYVDDLVMRKIARGTGILTFGTVALISSLRERGTIDADEEQLALDQLRREYCVDLLFDPTSIARVASEDQWSPRGAAFSFSRPSAWQAAPVTLSVWKNCYQRAAEHAPELAPGWLYHAVRGATAALGDSTKIAATLLLFASNTSDNDPDRFPALLEATRQAIRDTALPDVLPEITRMIIEALVDGDSPFLGARFALSLSSKLAEVDRFTVREIVFG